MRRVPATVITGFLGAGKTSLVRHLLAHADGRRLAVIVNEFGELGIDRELLLGCGDAACGDEDIVELANGCLCCTVADDFLPTLTRLLDRAAPPEHILIETSGLALPKPLVQAFAWPEIRTRTTVDGVLTVIDGAAVAAGLFAADPEAVARQRAADPALAHDNPLEEVFADQLACADLVILNKTDLIDPERLAALSREDRGAASPGCQARQRARREGAAGGGAGPRRRGRGRSCLPPLGARARSRARSRRFRELCRDRRAGRGRRMHSSLACGPRSACTTCCRVKGFVDLPGRDRRQVVQAVGDRLQQHFDRPWHAGETRETRLVVIGRKGLDRAAITAALGG